LDERQRSGGALVRFVSAFQIEMGDEAARVSARTKVMIKWMMRSTADRHPFHVSADAPVDVIDGAAYFPAIESEKSMPQLVIVFFKVSHLGYGRG
jgi:hypothetical protein